MNRLGAHAFDLLCLTIAVTLAAHAAELPLYMSGPLGALLALRWWQRRRIGFLIPAWVKLPLVALLLLAVIATWHTPFGREPGSAMAVGLLVLKLLESERSRDARAAVAFAAFTLMSALLASQSLVATLMVSLGLVPALACLRALETPPQTRLVARSTWLPNLRALALGLPLALIAFVFVPRLSTPLWGSPANDAGNTGLSPHMAPGDMTDLLIDDRVAMRVEFEGAPAAPAARYFRGYVMEFFDGRGWHAGAALAAEAETLEVLDELAYRIELEPTGQNLIPALDVLIAAPPDTRFGRARQLFGRRGATGLTRHALRSATRYRLGVAGTDAARAAALVLPPAFNPRSRDLAASWRMRHGGDSAAIVDEALRLIRDGGFSYTLAPAPLGRDSVDDFLFATREGFCEHYASSFAFLMRAAGVPTRVVTGYQGGDWNARERYLIVRYSDAHAWNEVWLEGRGWVRVDPTAAVRPERVNRGAAAAAGASAAWYQRGWRRALGNRWDVVNRWWGQRVIGFNALRQKDILKPLGIPRADLAELMIALAVASIALLALATFLALRQPRRRDPLAQVQARLERALAGAGVQRHASEGPRDFFVRAAAALPDRSGQLQALGARYLGLRYGKSELAPGDVARYRREVRDFCARRVVK